MAPTRLGPYEIVTPLGRGGMGAVYEARDPATGRVVAVKTLAAHLGDDPGLRRRFLGEIETLKGLRHPCIVELLAFGEEDGQPYFAMELVRGRSLEQLLRSGRRFAWRETVDVALAITRALKSAHDHGVVHRDLKPANLLFPDDPAGDAVVKLADFGIARLFGSAATTMAGTIVGTAEYMAPEQATGSSMDHRVDLYALGLVIFAMLAGRPPFHGGQATDIIQRQRHEPAPRLASRVAGVPRALDELVDRLLAKDPARRPASTLAVGRQLAAIAAEAEPADVASAGRDGSGITLGGAASPTDCDESRRGTSAGMAPAWGGPAGRDVDLVAVTRDFGPGDTRRPAILMEGQAAAADAATKPVTSPASGTPPGGTSLPQRITVPANAPAEAAAPRTTRFTTVEELERATAADAESRRRREFAMHAVASACLLAAVAAAAFMVLRPPTADELHASIRTIADAPDADLRDARSLIERFLATHPADPRAGEIRELKQRIDLNALEQRGRRRRRDDSALMPLEREYRAAMDRENESPLACVSALDAILVLHASDAATPAADGTPLEEQPALWLELVRRQLARLEPFAERERQQDVARATDTLERAARLAADARDAGDATARQDLLDRRHDLLSGLVEIYAARPHAAEAVAEARRQLEATP
ncbi:MAG: serine/threonine-protein kinase [Planctomycetaceae bacterium]